MRRALLVVALAALVLPGAAHAAFPGLNGKIAFDASDGSDTEIFVMNPNGSGRTQLTTNSSADVMPAWSADGSQIAFLSTRDNSNGEIYTMSADGTGETRVTTNAYIEHDPSWSADGSQIVFTRFINNTPQLVIADLNASGETTLSNAGRASQPAWSPDGGRIAYIRDVSTNLDPVMNTIKPDDTGTVPVTEGGYYPQQPNWSPEGGRFVYALDGCGFCSQPVNEIWSMNRDGSNRTELACCFSDQPSWSPDGTTIVFRQGVDCDPIGNFCTSYHPATMSSAGGPVTILPDTGNRPDWQPLPYPGYARPKGATPTRIALVPAHAQCTSANRTHGPPLAFGSCNPGAPESATLTTGTPDLNGQATGMNAFVRYGSIVGNPSTPADEADLALRVEVTDVRVQNTLADYSGSLRAETTARLVDRTLSGGDPATTIDFSFPPVVPCAPTASPSIGSTCSLDTTVDALIPGAITEGQRSILQLGQVQVIDGGADGDPATTPNTVFLRQGVFVP